MAECIAVERSARVALLGRCATPKPIFSGVCPSLCEVPFPMVASLTELRPNSCREDGPCFTELLIDTEDWDVAK